MCVLMESSINLNEAMSASGGTADPVVHLVVVSHGLHGTPERVNPIAQAIRDSIGDVTHVHVHTATANAGILSSMFSTRTGVKNGGERLAAEIAELARKIPTLRYISLIGLSLGGLYIRAAAPIITKLGLTPLNFITFASPHLGVRNHLMGVIETAIRWGALGQTGYDLLLNDDTGEGGIPILQWMADPASEYYKALQMFSNRVLLANLQGDDKVPHWSAALVSSTEMLQTLANDNPDHVRSCYSKTLRDKSAPAVCRGLKFFESDTGLQLDMGTFHHINAIYVQKPWDASIGTSTDLDTAVADMPKAASGVEDTARAEACTFFKHGVEADPLESSTSLEATMCRNLRRLGGWINVDVLFEEFGGAVLNHIRIGGAVPPKWMSALYDFGPSAGTDVLAFAGQHLFLTEPHP